MRDRAVPFGESDNDGLQSIMAYIVRSAAPTQEPTTTTSVDKALLLLTLISQAQALRVAEAAELLNIARSTAHRLLTALTRNGFVIQDRPHGAYRPGPALYEAGLAAVSRDSIRRISRPILEQIVAATQETATLGIIEGTMVRFIDCVESPHSLRMGNHTGVVRPAHTTAIGKAILAGLTDAEVERRYPDGELPPAPTAAAITDLATLRTELIQIRQQGFAVNQGESSEGLCAVAAALPASAGQPMAAFAVTAPTSRTGISDAIRVFAPAVRRGVDAVLEQLHTQQARELA